MARVGALDVAPRIGSIAPFAPTSAYAARANNVRARNMGGPFRHPLLSFGAVPSGGLFLAFAPRQRGRSGTRRCGRTLADCACSRQGATSCEPRGHTCACRRVRRRLPPTPARTPPHRPARVQECCFLPLLAGAVDRPRRRPGSTAHRRWRCAAGSRVRIPAFGDDRLARGRSALPALADAAPARGGAF